MKLLYWLDLLKKDNKKIGNKIEPIDHNQLDFPYHLKSYIPILCICGCTGTVFSK